MIQNGLILVVIVLLSPLDGHSQGLRFWIGGGGGVSSVGPHFDLSVTMAAEHFHLGGVWIYAADEVIFGSTERRFAGIRGGLSRRSRDKLFGLSAGFGLLSGRDEDRPQDYDCFLGCPSATIGRHLGFMLGGHAITSVQFVGLSLEPVAIIGNGELWVGITARLLLGKFE